MRLILGCLILRTNFNRRHLMSGSVLGSRMRISMFYLFLLCFLVFFFLHFCIFDIKYIGWLLFFRKKKFVQGKNLFSPALDFCIDSVQDKWWFYDLLTPGRCLSDSVSIICSIFFNFSYVVCSYLLFTQILISFFYSIWM